MSAALYPHVAKEFFKFRAQYGPVDRLETRYGTHIPTIYLLQKIAILCIFYFVSTPYHG
jgi:hypothetical protein